MEPIEVTIAYLVATALACVVGIFFGIVTLIEHDDKDARFAGLVVAVFCATLLAVSMP